MCARTHTHTHGITVKVYANGLGDQSSILGRVIRKTQNGT